MLRALRRHWPEYLMEAAGVAIFMIVLCLAMILFMHPGSPLRQGIESDFVRRALMGFVMGLAILSLIGSPWGQRSGAHLNPAITLGFFRLGKIEGADALCYIVAQFTGGVAGVNLMTWLFGLHMSDPAVNWAATAPGPWGSFAALLAEIVISFVLMMVILLASNTRELSRYTPLLAAALIAIFVMVEAPISGMSMNPARSFAPAVPASLLSVLWIYFTAPPLGMLLAAEAYQRLRGVGSVFCAKLHHHNTRRCIFRCRYPWKPQGRRIES